MDTGLSAQQRVAHRVWGGGADCCPQMNPLLLPLPQSIFLLYLAGVFGTVDPHVNIQTPLWMALFPKDITKHIGFLTCILGTCIHHFSHKIPTEETRGKDLLLIYSLRGNSSSQCPRRSGARCCRSICLKTPPILAEEAAEGRECWHLWLLLLSPLLIFLSRSSSQLMAWCCTYPGWIGS